MEVSVHAHAVSDESVPTLDQYVQFFCTSMETPSPNVEKLQKEILHLKRIKSKFKDEAKFIQFAFYRIHRKFLKNYKLYSTLPQLLEEGNYDCVSGTALYAVFFQFLNIKYEIREMAYHVYLLAYTSNHQLIVVESTDPFYGCIIELDKIKAYAAQMRAQQLIASNANQYQYQHIIDQAVSLHQLAGLQFFNAAIHWYNQAHLEKARKYLALAFRYYSSQRMYEFKKLMELYAYR